MVTTNETGTLAPPQPRLADLIDRATLDRAIDKGLVSVRAAGDLRILNYTPRATYSRSWNPATLLCRGLIVDAGGRVLARPFPKFFNADEPDAPPIPRDVPMVVTEKLDGSLGIAYHAPDGAIRIATRGSLVSEQAVEASRIWRDKYRRVRFGRDVTPLFEIIYPSNRVVVDYGDQRDLILLAVIDIRTGADLPLGCLDWPGPVAEQHEFGSFSELADAVSAGSETGGEGYVARFDTGACVPHVRFKFKFPEYVVAHRIVTGLNSLRVWEVVAVTDVIGRGISTKTAAARLRLDPDTVEAIARRGSDPVGSLRADLPEEFWSWYETMVEEYRVAARRLAERYEVLVSRARSESGATGGRAFAEAAIRLSSESGLPTGPLFALNQGRVETYASIWTQLRPEDGGDTPERRLPPVTARSGSGAT